MTEKYTYYTMSSKEKASIVEKIRRIVAEADVVLTIIFGSFIELDSFRDIDIAIYTKGKTDIDKVIKLTNKLEEALNIPIHIILIDKINPSFRLNILRRGVIVLEEPGIYEALFMQTIDELTLLTKH